MSLHVAPDFGPEITEMDEQTSNTSTGHVA